MNTEKRVFDVHIIESNKPTEKDAEADALAGILTISGIQAHKYNVKTIPELQAAILKISKHPRCIPHHRHFLPFLHFALHANQTGILLQGKELVEWNDLLELLLPLRNRLEGNLLICMSACEGFYGYKMACSAEKFTYHFMVGTKKTIDWRDAILAYHIFYHQLFFRKARFHEAAKAMNVDLLSRHYSFDYTYGSEVRRLSSQNAFTTDEKVVAIRGKGN